MLCAPLAEDRRCPGALRRNTHLAALWGASGTLHTGGGGVQPFLRKNPDGRRGDRGDKRGQTSGPTLAMHARPKSWEVTSDTIGDTVSESQGPRPQQFSENNTTSPVGLTFLETVQSSGLNQAAQDTENLWNVSQCGLILLELERNAGAGGPMEASRASRKGAPARPGASDGVARELMTRTGF
ncbi:hypothetical protein H8959_019783 [Pygathrix nigripes]